MKPILNFVLCCMAAIACFLVAIYLYSVALKPALFNSAEFAILYDKTDSLLSKPNANQILHYAKVDEHKWQMVSILSVNITDYEYNPSLTLSLSARFFLFANPIERDNEIAVFKQKLSKDIALIARDSKPKPYSSIYQPMVRELNRLSYSSAKNRILFLFSDLQENTKDFSIHRKEDRELLVKDIQKVIAHFQQSVKLRNLGGIKVYLIFSPRNARDNEYFILMASLYEKMLTDKGAEVYIGANVPNP